MSDAFTRLWRNLSGRIDGLESRTPEVLYGRVEQVSPLSVRLSSGVLVEDVESLEPVLNPNDQVRLVAHGGFRLGRRLVVMGKVSNPLPSRIPAGSDLNSYTTPGTYYSPANVDVATFTNGPPDNAAGALVVLESAGTQQFWHSYDNSPAYGRSWRRRLYGTSWSAWEPINRVIKTTVTLLNGWVNYRGPFELAGYSLDRAGRVHLTGLVRYGTIGQPIMNLPPQCRPAASIIFACASSNGSSNVMASVYVTSDGNVTPNSGGTSWLSLAGISFDAAY